jgi:hypothetical protein
MHYPTVTRSLYLLLLCLSSLVITPKSAQAQCLTSNFGTSDCNGNFLVLNPGISSFIFASTTHTSAGCDNTTTGRTFFSTPVFNVTQSQTYSFTINSNANLTYYAAIWIDYNNNSQFESTENVWNSGSTSNTSFTGNITIPGTTAIGTVRMRVRTCGETVMTGNDACTSFLSVLFSPNADFGETHDYDVNISGSTPSIDMSATALITPTTPLCATNSNVVVQVRNNSATTINFATNNVTVNAAVSVTNPQTFPAVILSSGTLASNATQNVTVATGYNMTSAGTYTFNASTTVTGDVNTTNDAMTATNITVNAAPTASLSGSSTICANTTAQLSFTLAGGGPYSLTYTDGVTPVTQTGITASPFVVTVTPSVTRTYTLTSASNSNCPASASGTHVVTVRPAATATLTGTATICPAGSTTLTVTFTGTSPWSYTYTDGTTPVTVTGITTNPYLITVTPPTARTYSGTTVGDFCGTGTVSGSAAISISASSSATIGGNANFCTGSSTSLQVNLSGASPWTITFSDGTTSFTRTGINSSPYTLSLTPTANTTYTLTGVTNPCGTGTASGSGTVTQITPPSVVLTGGETICSGNGSQLTASFTGTSPWVLTYSNGTTNAQVTANTNPYLFTLTPSVTTTYTATAVSMPGCSSGTASGSAVIVIGGTASASLSGGASVCSGQGANLTVNLSGGSPYSFVYSNGVGNTTVNNITSSPYSLSVTPGVNTTYSLVSMNSTGCGSGAVSGSALVTVANQPIGILSGGGSICQSGTAQLTTTLNGSAPWTFSYTNGTSTITVTGVTASPYSFPVSPSVNPTTYTLTQVSDSNCGTGLFTGSASFVVGTPTTGILSGPASVCAGTNAVLTFTLTGGQAPFTLTYTQGTTPITLTGISNNPYSHTVLVSSTTTYTLLTVSNSICPGGLSPSSIVIGINPPPTAAFTATVSNDSVVLLNTSTMATSYSWNSGTNSNWVSGTNPVFVYGVSGTYVITLATAGPCGVDTTQQTVVVVVPVSNESLLEEMTLGIYPNPSEGKFRVELPNELQNQELLVQITDLAGKIVYSGQRKEQKDLTLELNASAGIYLLQLNGAGKIWKGKVVVR